MKDMGITIILIGVVVWLLNGQAALPETIHLEGPGLLAIPMLAGAAWLMYKGRFLAAIGVILAVIFIWGGVL
jgi:hypothetical protein